jgi:ferredoxin-fold anticodon binding domain-containing protein
MEGLITRSRAQKLQQQVNSLLATFDASIDENVILPKCSTLVALRIMQQEEAESDHEDQTATVKNGPVQLQNRPV